LRYDNRWLKTYWDGKLKEVEKEPNFYVSTPIKNKLFDGIELNYAKISPLNLNIINNGVVRNVDSTSINTNNMALKNSIGSIEGGEIKSVLNTNPMYLYLYSLKNILSLDTNFSEYRLSKNFYNKNSKFLLKGLDDVNSCENLWLLSRNNSISRVYPNLNKTMLSGNLLISSKESEGGFNTNLVSIKNPNFSAFDRYFLSLSKKNTLDLSRVNRDLEQSISSSKFSGL